MTFLNPAGLWFLLSLPAILVLYLIQSRHRPQVVASLLLWKRMARDLEAEAAWRRPRWDLLLALQLLTALAISVALARPALQGVSEQHLVIVLDTSASMAARDVSPTRLAAAKQAVADVVNAQPPATPISLITAGKAPTVVVENGTSAEVEQALDDVQAEPDAGDLTTSVRVASSLASTGGEVVVVTDGAFNANLPPEPVHVTFKLVGGGPQGLAVSEVSLRRPVEGSDYLAGFARVVNAGSDAQTTTLAILADGVLVDRSPIDVPAAGHAEATFRVPSGAQTLSVGLTERGALPAADRVDLVGYAHLARTVVLVSDTPAMWQHVFSVVPNVLVRMVRPADFAATDVTPDSIYLFDGVVPQSLPQAASILVNPPDTSGDILGRVDTLQRQRRAINIDADDPLLEGVDIAPLNVQQLERAVTPPWAAASVAAEDTPLILHGRLGQQPVVIFTFDPNKSNLPHLAAFPQLMANTVDWLTPGRQAVLTGGLGQEADIQPRPHADMLATASAVVAAAVPHEIWPWVLAGAVLLFSAEWAVAVRRG